MTIHPILAEVTQRIVERSHVSRAAYLAKIEGARGKGAKRHHLSCGNLAHGFAACGENEESQGR